jgi:hypothetical protein
MTFTLKELASPINPVSSTVAVSLSIPGWPANSFSFPAFFYYAFKARTLSRLGVSDERDLANHSELDIHKAVLSEIREAAKTVRLLMLNTKNDNSISIATQSKMMNMLLNDSHEAICVKDLSPSIPINTSKPGKNITVPAYLYNRLEALFGGKKAAKSQVYDMMASIFEEIKAGGGLDDNNKLIGDATHTSWSRKLHNKFFFMLLKLSDIPELHAKVSILDVKLIREPKIETKVRNGTLCVAKTT